MVRVFLFGFTVFFAACSGAEATQFNAVYNVLRAGQVVGEAHETFSTKDGEYHIESKIAAMGIVAVFVKETFRQTSNGQISTKGLRPLDYAYERSQNSDKNIRAQFNWDTKTATFQFDGKTETKPLPPMLQDRLSLFYQFKYWPKNKSSLRIPMSNGKGISDYVIVRGPQETLNVPAGGFRAIRYTRERTQDDDGVSVWMTDKYPAPVKIVIDGRKGERTEQVLVRVTQD